MRAKELSAWGVGGSFQGSERLDALVSEGGASGGEGRGLGRHGKDLGALEGKGTEWKELVRIGVDL